MTSAELSERLRALALMLGNLDGALRSASVELHVLSREVAERDLRLLPVQDGETVARAADSSQSASYGHVRGCL